LAAIRKAGEPEDDAAPIFAPRPTVPVALRVKATYHHVSVGLGRK
jgi:hypothetical protein